MKQFFLGIFFLFSVTSLSAQEKWIYWTSYEAGKTKLSRLKMATRQVEVVKDSVGMGYGNFAVDVVKNRIYHAYGILDLQGNVIRYFPIILDEAYQNENVHLDRRSSILYLESSIWQIGSFVPPFSSINCYNTELLNSLFSLFPLSNAGCSNFKADAQIHQEKPTTMGNGYVFIGQHLNPDKTIKSRYIGRHYYHTGHVETVVDNVAVREVTGEIRADVFSAYYWVVENQLWSKYLQQPVLLFDNLQNPRDLAVNIAGERKIYWLENNRICRANLDGTGFEVIVKDLNAPIAMALSFDQNYTVATEQEEVPSAVEAVSVFPNPFQQEATFSYELKQESNVQLSIFDILGREIVILVDAPQGIGTYKINWKDSASSAGMYIWRLKTKNNVQQGSFIKVK